MTFWAHSDRNGLAFDAPESNWQRLSDHLRNVATLARLLAQYASPNYVYFHDLAERCGLLHDYGKYIECFQQMLTFGKRSCPHAIYGASIAFHALNSRHIAAAIAGHHAGIPDLTECQDKTKKNFAEALRLKDHAMADCPEIRALLQNDPPPVEHVKEFDLLARMLFSCLVDADRLDTAGRAVVQAPLEASSRLEAPLAHIGKLARNESDVNQVRRKVLSDCLRAAAYPEPILSLSVPTGGGKTLSSMAFALQRAALEPDRYRRIIVVIPYLSIIEQNAKVYADIFGSDAILEHHSGSFTHLRVGRSNLSEEAEKDRFVPQGDDTEQYKEISQRPETENWDAPLVVTTSVRFFESLFSNHPSDVRRIHNIARSIVILDEVQVFPRRLLAPLLGMIDELATKWGCSFVLSTATKPAFERSSAIAADDPRWSPGKIREIVESPDELHRSLRRVNIDWRIERPVDWSELAGWILQNHQALCVVNVREHATALYNELRSRVPSKDVLFHLSTRMCPAHRLDVIAQIRERLQMGLPCLVVSTQLIEAGVDLDFPIAFRALGPLDSIIQVAGRVDREGRLTANLGQPAGKLVVFVPVDNRMPPNEYESAAGFTETLAKTCNIQPDDIQSMADFFEAYYTTGDLGAAYVKLREEGKFRTLAHGFEMISSRTRDIYVPYGEGRTLIDQLMERGQLDADLRRALQRYTVGLYPWEFGSAKSSALYQLREDSEIWIAGDNSYSPDFGLKVSQSPDGVVL